jgi:two-component system, NtrC family, sensor histidine kinase HydH
MSLSHSHRPRVLVVDDNAAFLDNLQELLAPCTW